MEWGIFGVAVLMILVSYAIIQETRAQLYWRDLVARGDVKAISELVGVEVERWKTERVPKGIPSLLWHGVQTIELLEVTAKGAHVSCNADAEYALVGGRRIEASSPLAEGMKITMKLAEKLLYDIPNVKLDYVQIDVYTSFREESGQAETRCILSTLVQRKEIEELDWEETPAADFVDLLKGRFSAGGGASARPIEPISWPSETAARA